MFLHLQHRYFSLHYYYENTKITNKQIRYYNVKSIIYYREILTGSSSENLLRPQNFTYMFA